MNTRVIIRTYGSARVVAKEHINKVWPLLCNSEPQSGDIRKFETLGTRSFPIEQGISEAIDFHNAIGPKRKEERIRYLKDYWATKASKIPGVQIHTSLKQGFSCAICAVSVKGINPSDLGNRMFSDYKIHTTAIDWENIHAIRVTPHVYTTIAELDTLVKALETIAKSV